MAGLKVGDRDLPVLEGISDEVKEECRRWKEHRRREGALPDDALEDWLCIDGSAIDGNGEATSRVGAAVVQLGGHVEEEGLMAILNEDMVRNPLVVRALCCSLGGV